MVTIRELVNEYQPQRIVDGHLQWGARASTYAAEIEDELESNRVPVLIELIDDLKHNSDRLIWLDHHGERSGEDQPTSLEQVFSLLKLPEKSWTRDLELVSVNDRGGIDALCRMGASPDEIASIRARDCEAQGVTTPEESAGRAAASQAETQFQGRLTVVTLPHSRTATVTDVFAPALGGPGFQNLLVHTPKSVHVFGEGTLIRTLAEQFPNGWYGGSLPHAGFWGHDRPVDGFWSCLRNYFGS